MKKLLLSLFVAALLLTFLAACNGGKQSTQQALSDTEIQEITELDSVSSEIEDTMEEIQATEAEPMEALDDINN